MNRQQLEIRVLAAVERLRNGQPVEDDLIEIKRGWPDTSRARQLAGAANRARGDDLIYIVGLDDDGAASPLDSTDPADWWARMRARFDEGIAPELVAHVTVALGEDEAVVALAFATDQAPYVVKTSTGGAQQLEVPIRDATGTRSASRSALLRMLAPQLGLPTVILLEADLSQNRTVDSTGGTERDVDVFFRLELVLYVQPQFNSPTMLPEHDVVCGIAAEDIEVSLRYDGSYGRTFGVFGARSDTSIPAPPLFAAYVRSDGIVATGPGTVRITFSGNAPLDSMERISAMPAWQLRVSFGVASTDRQIDIPVVLTPRERTPQEIHHGTQRWHYKRARRPYAPHRLKTERPPSRCRRLARCRGQGMYEGLPRFAPSMAPFPSLVRTQHPPQGRAVLGCLLTDSTKYLPK